MACPNVQKLTLGKCDNLDDELMFNILQSQSLQKCEELCLCDAPGLTQESVRTILMNLDKYVLHTVFSPFFNFFFPFRIHFLGRLDTWNISWLEVEELRFEIQAYNMDVKLWEYFSNLERQDAVDLPDVQPNQQPQIENFEELIFGE